MIAIINSLIIVTVVFITRNSNRIFYPKTKAKETKAKETQTKAKNDKYYLAGNTLAETSPNPTLTPSFSA